MEPLERNRLLFTDNDTILVSISADDNHNIPNTSITLIKSIDEDDTVFITRGSTTMIDRSDKDLKPYKISDTSSAIIYYNSDKQIHSIAMEHVDDLDSARAENEEILRFIELNNDKQAYSAYMLLATYWAAIAAGMAILTGSLMIEDEDL